MERWDPWEQLEETEVDLWFAELDRERGRWTRSGSTDTIVLETSLDRRTRTEVLAHELVHVERGIGWPDASAATMQLEEERVWRIALGRLAPPDAVRRFLRRRGSVGPVTVHDLAEEFDLSVEAARRVAALVALQPGAGVDDDA